MGKYISNFETTAEFEAVELNLDRPHVSLTKDNMEVHYNPYVDPYAGYEYVDLGLPSGTKWAKYNVGANSETDYGNYYGYGKGAKTHQETYGEPYYTGAENPLTASADTATQAWSEMWHMPTKEQFSELCRYTTHEWTTIDGVNGAKFSSQNGNYIFLPAAGYFYDTILLDEGQRCEYYTSTPDGSNKAYYFFMTNDDYDIWSNTRDDYGSQLCYSIRPVVG